jgi:hypothetical protein
MKCQYCGPEETEFCVGCEQFFCSCYGCSCLQHGVFRKPKPDNPYEDPEIRQVCLKCGFRKASPHALACPFCFPQGMIYELVWARNLELGAVSQPIPPIREDQPYFKALSIMGQVESVPQADNIIGSNSTELESCQLETPIVHPSEKNVFFVHQSESPTQLSFLGGLA